ncbi:MAG TPA: ROK family protein [Xanthobacteraceae bacterium]|jgi:glucokinase|nr:ROK family protein [Xanthobacteraceae bacterium]
MADKSSTTSLALIADIGGTNSRFALVEAQGQPQQVRTYEDDDFKNLEGVVTRYLKDTEAAPTIGIFAVAAPITGPDIALTNRDWRFNVDAVAQQFGLSRLHVLNDFEAAAWALTRLEDSEMRAIGHFAAGDPPQGARVVLGPGTGLGVAALLPAGDDWHAVPTEGGHISFGPATDDEDAIFARLRADGPVSAETILCGRGLARLYAAMQPDRAPLEQHAIVKAAQANDTEAGAVTDMFVRMLGRFAGDMALLFKATGGVYVAGGVAAALGQRLDADIFRHAFEAHPPYPHLLEKIPTSLVTANEMGLLGCAAYAAMLARRKN